MATPKRRYPILEKRRYYLDVLRIVAICAIVLLHVAGSYWYQLGVYTSEWQAINLYDCITRWGVPVFVMISGALFLDPAREQPIKKLWTRNIPKLVRLILFWGLLYALVYDLPNIWTGESVAGFIHDILFGTPHLWFLFMLLGLYIAVPILRCITANEQVMRYFLVFAFVMNFIVPLATGAGTIPGAQEFFSAFMIQLPLGYTFYFVLGYYLASHDTSRTMRWTIYVLAILTLTGAVLCSSWVSLEQGSANALVIRNHFPFMFAAAAVFILVKQCFTRRWGDLVQTYETEPETALANLPKDHTHLETIRELSACTLGVYVVHIFVLRALIAMGFSAVSFDPIIAAPVMALVTIVISFGIAYVLKKIPFFGKYFV